MALIETDSQRAEHREHRAALNGGLTQKKVFDLTPIFAAMFSAGDRRPNIITRAEAKTGEKWQLLNVWRLPIGTRSRKKE